jgi:hypothetical protein
LGRSIIPKIDEIFDAKSQGGKKKVIVADLDALAYNKLILSIDDKTSSVKLGLIWSKDARVRIMLMVMRLLYGNAGRTILNLFLVQN